jgi:hypothetical protein
MTQFRQGDVWIEACAIPTDAKKNARRKRITLAEGEVTGHAHILVADRVTVESYEKDGVLYLHVEAPTDLVHEEHGKITIPPGDYKSYIQREYTPEAIRNVAD